MILVAGLIVLGVGAFYGFRWYSNSNTGYENIRS
jgi:hypothetical protein